MSASATVLEDSSKLSLLDKLYFKNSEEENSYPSCKGKPEMLREFIKSAFCVCAIIIEKRK